MTEAVIDLADGGRAVLRDDDGAYRAENLICLNSDGSSRWTAALPRNSGPDRFVGAGLQGSSIRANTWSGWVIWFDCSSGAVLKTAFGK
jgi:hypothetical protein